MFKLIAKMLKPFLQHCQRLSVLHNCFGSKLFSDLYLAKFLTTSAKLFPCTDDFYSFEKSNNLYLYFI